MHRLADGFLRTCNGGTDRAYAYLLVDHLRWLEFEGLSPDTVTVPGLCRYMAAVGAERADPTAGRGAPARHRIRRIRWAARPLRAVAGLVQARLSQWAREVLSPETGAASVARGLAGVRRELG